MLYGTFGFSQVRAGVGGWSMRVLFSCVAAFGHFRPLVPLARAFADDGHDVAFATSASFAEHVRGNGFDVLPAGIDQDELERRFRPFRAHLRTLPIAERRPLAFTTRFAKLEAPAKVGALRALVDDWRPELLVHDSADLAAPLVAASRALPSAHHAFGQLIPIACLERASDETAALWRDTGLEPEPLCGVYRGPYVDLCPPSLQRDAPPEHVRIEPVRPLFPAGVGESAPPWLPRLGGRTTVYVTLGTIHNELAIFRLLLDALAGLDAAVAMTVGPGNDPADLGSIPENALVERYVSQSLVLPAASVVVSHGGSGSMLATLAHGLPSLVLPQGADQFDNAARCSELGAAVALMPDEVTESAVRDAVRTLLDDPSYRNRAAALAAEIAAMPHPREVARRLAGTVAAPEAWPPG
jgi:UDP:flavonoid glycosyltransferase YjiC (YdhE family)